MIYGQQDGEVNSVIMTESQALQRVSAYVAENRMIAALEDEVKYMSIKANEQVPLPEGPGKILRPKDTRLKKGGSAKP